MAVDYNTILANVLAMNGGVLPQGQTPNQAVASALQSDPEAPDLLSSAPGKADDAGILAPPPPVKPWVENAGVEPETQEEKDVNSDSLDAARREAQGEPPAPITLEGVTVPPTVTAATNTPVVPKTEVKNPIPIPTQSGPDMGGAPLPPTNPIYGNVNVSQNPVIKTGIGPSNDPNVGLLQDYTAATEDKFGIPHGLLAGLIQNESNWNPKAHNENRDGTNDDGIAQFNSGGTAQAYKLMTPSGDYRSDPHLSIDAAGQYLADNFKKSGDWNKAIQMYNPHDPNYVNKVLSNAQAFGFGGQVPTAPAIQAGIQSPITPESEANDIEKFQSNQENANLQNKELTTKFGDLKNPNNPGGTENVPELTAAQDQAKTINQGQIDLAQHVQQLDRQDIDGGLAAIQKLNADHFDPDHFWNSRSSAQKFGIGLSMILGSLGGAATGGVNSGVSTLNNAISRDLDVQKLNVDKDKDVVNAYNQYATALRTAGLTNNEAAEGSRIAIEDQLHRIIRTKIAASAGSVALQQYDQAQAATYAEMAAKKEAWMKAVHTNNELQAQAAAQAQQTEIGRREFNKYGLQMPTGILERAVPNPEGEGYQVAPTKEAAQKAEEIGSQYQPAIDALADLVQFTNKNLPLGATLDRETVNTAKAKAAAAKAALRNAVDLKRISPSTEQEFDKLIPDDPSSYFTVLPQMRATWASMIQQRNSARKPYGINQPPQGPRNF